MLINISNSWKKVLEKEFQKDYFKELVLQVEDVYNSNICFPPKELIFNAFNSCAFEDVKVVIIGQDPYHGVGEANGLCFSVNNDVKIPPSLRNIYREIASDLDTVFMPNDGNLQHWANQGVLLLNASLTVRKDTPNSHKHLQWNLFTDEVIRIISDKKENVVFLLWGAFAQKKGAKIDASKHLILTSGHPSPMSANQGKWFGNKHFSQTNAYLTKNEFSTIFWF